MSHLEVPLFPRGFLLSRFQVEPPATYVQGPLLSNFYLHPWTRTSHATRGENIVIIIGLCTSTVRQDTDDPAQVLLESLLRSKADFFTKLGQYSGRHAVIFGTRDHLKIVNDATAMRSVFYATTGGVVASHALLVERALGGKIGFDDLPIRYGYPGNRTPHPRTKLLTANTYYDIATHKIKRFWPTQHIEPTTPDEAAQILLETSSTVLENVAQDHPVKLAFTAGLDSRCLLAAAIHAGINFDTYTYGRNKDTQLDRDFAQSFMSRWGFPHTVPGYVTLSAEEKEAILQAHSHPHHLPAMGSMIHWVEDRNTVAVTANLLEIGRDFYGAMRRNGTPEPRTPETMAALYRSRMGIRGKEQIPKYGEDKFTVIAESAFAEFIDDTNYLAAIDFVLPFDLNYWEHRMAAWHGLGMLERDFYAEAFIPFNSRGLFETLLGLDLQHRESGIAFYKMIELVNPDLLTMPVNPQSWPSQ